MITTKPDLTRVLASVPMFEFSKASLINRQGVDAKLIEISDLALRITVIDFGIPLDGGVRSAARQKQLHDSGKSQADGYTNLSRHQSGKALDFYAYVDHEGSWHPGHLAMVAAAFLQAASMLTYKLKWGGFWRPVKRTQGIDHGWDMAHVELID